MPDAPRTPIADYALVGDTRTAALVSSGGAVDWLCAPRFDSPPLFGRLVGGAAAGTYVVAPERDAAVIARRYRPGTATVETVWRTPGGAVTLTDGMVGEVGSRLLPRTLLVRRIAVDGEPVRVRVHLAPALGARHGRPSVRRDGAGRLLLRWRSLAIALTSDPPIELDASGACTITIEPGAPRTLALAVADREPVVLVPPDVAWRALLDDERWWREWAARVDADVPCRDLVVRSLITLRLLTYSPSGAPVAAPTTSLPELLGGARNWDYRYSWPRDASIGVAAFLALGHTDEAERFLAWLLHASRLDRPRLPPLLSLDGKHAPADRTLEGWPGYANSAPVRVGNTAGTQHQLDTYGWVLDAAWLVTRSGRRLNGETWRAMAGFADHVAARWRDPDAGIWEVRDEEQHYVHSKLMAWLALDRAVRIAATRRVRGARVARWRTEREAVAADVRRHGYDATCGRYARAYGSRAVDAAVLVLPLLGFEPRDSARVGATIDAIAHELDAGWPLIHRYPPGADGLAGGEGAFLPCAFWLVQALAAVGRVDEAVARFDALTELASPVGLYAEELDPRTHEHLGNYPQALTHAALVQAALALRDAGVR